MVVDDQPTNVELIKAILKNDYEIIPAYSGKEALEKVNSEKPDIVLLDVMMPGIDGYEVCRIIKQEESTRFIPVVMITALSELDDRIKANEVDADDFLTKPINSHELVSRIRSLLKAKYYYDQLVESKEIIEGQNDFKTIIIDLIPYLFKSIDSEKKSEVISQMSKQVEVFLWAKHIQDYPKDVEQMAQLCCTTMNKLGANFSVDKIDKKSFTILNTICPWGDAKINPTFCLLCRAIFTRLGIRVSNDVIVNIKKNMANGDDYCSYKILMFKGDNS